MVIDPLSINETNIDAILDNSVKLGFLDYYGKLYECRYYEHRYLARKICEDNNWTNDPDYRLDPETTLSKHGFVKILKNSDHVSIDVYPVFEFHFSEYQKDYLRNLICTANMNPVTRDYLKEEVLEK